MGEGGEKPVVGVAQGGSGYVSWLSASASMPSLPFLLQLATFSLLFLSTILLIVGYGAPWLAIPFTSVTAAASTCGGYLATTSLTSSCYAGTVVPFPPASVYSSMGAASTAFLVFASLCSGAAALLSGVALQRAGAREAGRVGALCGRLLVPALGALGESPTLPAALVGVAWAAFACALIGLSVGVSLFATALRSTAAVAYPLGTTFPGRDAAATAFVFTLAAAVLATALANRCCCRLPAGGAIAFPSAAPAAQLNPMVALAARPAPPPQQQQPPGGGWLRRSDGADVWFENQTTKETLWARPPGAVLVG